MNNWFNPEVSVGNIITALSVFVSSIALLITLNKDRQLRKKEYADRIRNAAGAVTAKLERRKEIFLSFFESIQPLITDTDIKLVKEQDVTAARDFLWRELGLAHAKCMERITDEGIEIAYKDLYGYDPSIQEVFGKAVGELKKIERTVSHAVLQRTQVAVMKFDGVGRSYVSAELGNTLRDACWSLAQEAGRLVDEVLTPFRGQMIDLIRAKDSEIMKRRIRINSAGEMFLRAAELTARFEASNTSSNLNVSYRGSSYTDQIRLLYGPCLKALGVLEIARKSRADDISFITGVQRWSRITPSFTSPTDSDASRSSLPASGAVSINIKDIIESISRESQSQANRRAGSSADLRHQHDPHKTADYRRYIRSQSDSHRKR